MSFSWSGKYSLTSLQNPLLSVMFPVKPRCLFPPVSDYSLNRQLLAKQKEIQSRFHSVFPHFFNSLKSLIFFVLFCFFCLFVCLFFFTSPLMEFDTSSIMRKRPGKPTVTKTNTIAQVSLSQKERGGRGELYRGRGWGVKKRGCRGEKRGCSKASTTSENRKESSLSVCSGGVTYIHTYHRYIIGIIWHRKASKPTER